MIYKDINRTRLTPDKMKYFEDASNISAIKNSIRNILLVPVGSLPGDPEFGSRLGTVLFNPLDGITTKLQDSFIREAVIKYEPRVRITDVSFMVVPEYNKINIKLQFDYIDSSTGRTLQDNTTVPVTTP